MFSLFKLFLIFAILLISTKFIGLVASIILGICLIAVIMQVSFLSLLDTVLASILDFQIVSLAIVVFLILLLSNLLKSSNQLNDIVKQFQKLHLSPKFLSIIMPALIGLLPMPGGALFSAPMVDTILADKQNSASLKVAINYWFRHVLEFFWPLYPGFLLAISLFKLPMWEAITLNIPLTLGGILIGWILLLSHINKDSSSVYRRHIWADIKDMLIKILPIILVIILMFAVDLIIYLLNWIGITFKITTYQSMIIGLIFAIFILAKQRDLSYRDIFYAMLNKNIIPMVLSVIAIMVFKDVLYVSHLIESIQQELSQSNVSTFLIILLLPLVSGLVTGVSIGFVGASFPLVLSLIGSSINEFNHIMFYYVLCFGMGFLGVMLSPVHICLILTKQYFNVNFYQIYKLLFPLVFSMFIWIIIIAFLYRWLLIF